MLFIFIFAVIAAFACFCAGVFKLIVALDALRHCRYRNLSEQYKHQLKIGVCLTFLPPLLLLFLGASLFPGF